MYFRFSFCPALTLISKKLKMSENIAGVTILAFGNASPDLFTALASYRSDTQMLYAQTFGKFEIVAYAFDILTFVFFFFL